MGYRKLGRPADQRKAMLRGLVTSLLQHGSIVTTETRAKEVQSIAEKLIGLAVKEANNYTTKQITLSAAKKDGKDKVVTKVVTSKNGNKYNVVEREVTKDLVKVDNPSRLAARKLALQWIYKTKEVNENNKLENANVLNKLFDEIAEKYKDKKGGYTRIVKTGVRRGDAAPMAILELV